MLVVGVVAVDEGNAEAEAEADGEGDVAMKEHCKMMMV